MQPQPDLRSTLTQIPGLADARVLRNLGGGGASDSWLVEGQGKQLVLRIDTPLARKLGLDRQAEFGVLETVAAAGIGPDVIWADLAAGVLVTAFIPGPVWSERNIHDPVRLQQLAQTLRRLHRLPGTAPAFNPGRAAHLYAKGIGSAAAEELAQQTTVLAAQLLAPGHPVALCHNDLVYMNLIGSEPVRLIDWEYAALGDPLFDFAVVVRHHRLSAAVASGFLQACIGTLDTKTSERFNAFCELYDLLAKLWYLAVSAH